MSVLARRLTVVMIDDSPEDRMVVRRALRGSAAEFQELTHAGPGLIEQLREVCGARAWRRSRSPLILLDLDLPERHGLSVLDEIKTDPVLRRVPVIVLTATTDPRSVDRVYELGAASYIEKRSQPDEFARAIQGFVVYWSTIARSPDHDPRTEIRADQGTAPMPGWIFRLKRLTLPRFGIPAAIHARRSWTPAPRRSVGRGPASPAAQSVSRA